MAWFRKDKKPLTSQDRRDVPTDVFDKCPGCGEILYRERLAQNLNVCPTCGHHMRISAEAYLSILLDRGTFAEMDEELRAADPLEFHDLKAYPNRIAAAEARGKSEAVITGTGRLDELDVAIAVMDFDYIGGSMGSVVGEKITRAAKRALGDKTPFIIVSASGGARMQEGIYSLMQMAKTSAALARLHEAGLPFVSIITNPTTGGVTASFAMLGDVNFAEPGALIGFAGPRVIEETIRQELPDGFQRAEFLRDHGMVDRVVDRRELKEMVALVLRHTYAGWAR
ncbi:MAG: acetyl-CoA carboxylase, carboxyltransferase subunit beta [Longimicrobiales bacterium]